MDGATYTITCSKGTDGKWLACVSDAQGQELAWGTGEHGPLDAASNAAFHASNKEYLETRAQVSS